MGTQSVPSRAVDPPPGSLCLPLVYTSCWGIPGAGGPFPPGELVWCPLDARVLGLGAPSWTAGDGALLKKQPLGVVLMLLSARSAFCVAREVKLKDSGLFLRVVVT